MHRQYGSVERCVHSLYMWLWDTVLLLDLCSQSQQSQRHWHISCREQNFWKSGAIKLYKVNRICCNHCTTIVYSLDTGWMFSWVAGMSWSPNCPKLGDRQGPITASVLPACPFSFWGREHDGAYQGLILTFYDEAKVPTSTCEVLKINGPQSFRAHSITISLAQYLEISVLGSASINQLYQLLYTIFF